MEGTDGDSTVPNTKDESISAFRRLSRPPGSFISHPTKHPSMLTILVSYKIDSKSQSAQGRIQVAGSTCGNNDADKPGMYMNHSVVSFQWAGDYISSGPDPSTRVSMTSAPAGVSTAPTGNFVAPAPVAAAAAPQTPAPAMAPPPVAPVPVVPHTAILTPPPPAPKGPAMTAKAAGAKYEDFIKNGWTDATLREHGYLAA